MVAGDAMKTSSTGALTTAVTRRTAVATVRVLPTQANVTGK